MPSTPRHKTTTPPEDEPLREIEEMRETEAPENAVSVSAVSKMDIQKIFVGFYILTKHLSAGARQRT